MPVAHRIRLTFLLGQALAAPATAQVTPESRAGVDVFDRFAPAVAAIRVMETNSNAKSASGSGFFVTADGHLVTNYHVIADWVLTPARYAVEVDFPGDTTARAEVLAVDVVNDLAVLRVDAPQRVVLRFARAGASQGDRLYAFGFPGDMGITIVEGTYNAYVEHMYHPRLHFTGSLNPGMSGGPTVNRAGEVVGVNVATAGNQLSMLVPAAHADSLLAAVLAPGYAPPADFVPTIGADVAGDRSRYVERLLAEPFPTVRLDRFQVPTRPAPFFECWGETDTEARERWEYLDHQCVTDDELFVSEDYVGSAALVFHRVVRSDTINRFRFAQLLTESFQVNSFWTGGHLGEVTPFRCHRDNVGVGGHAFVAVLCTRKLLRFADLYDVVFKAATLGVGTIGLETTLQMSAIQFDNALRVMRAFLESITWAP